MAITIMKRRKKRKKKEQRRTKDLMTIIAELCTIAGFPIALYIFIKEALKW